MDYMDMLEETGPTPSDYEDRRRAAAEEADERWAHNATLVWLCVLFGLTLSFI